MGVVGQGRVGLGMLGKSGAGDGGTGRAPEGPALLPSGASKVMRAQGGEPGSTRTSAMSPPPLRARRKWMVSLSAALSGGSSAGKPRTRTVRPAMPAARGGCPAPPPRHGLPSPGTAPPRHTPGPPRPRGPGSARVPAPVPPGNESESGAAPPWAPREGPARPLSAAREGPGLPRSARPDPARPRTTDTVGAPTDTLIPPCPSPNGRRSSSGPG